MSEGDRIKTFDALYTAAGSVTGREATKKFLKELLTESERIMLGRRVLIARKLLFGKTYNEIVEELGVGKDTIMKVSHWLDDQMPGYEEAIMGLEREEQKREKDASDKYLYATSALYRLKKKYPMHFLLFPTPKPKSKK